MNSVNLSSIDFVIELRENEQQIFDEVESIFRTQLQSEFAYVRTQGWRELRYSYENHNFTVFFEVDRN